MTILDAFCGEHKKCGKYIFLYCTISVRHIQNDVIFYFISFNGSA